MSLGRMGDYEILERIGQGGMGVVFKARDTRLDRIVALKVVAEEHAADPEFRARLLREARAEAALSHPAIATCFEIGQAVVDPPDLLRPGAPGPPSQPASFLAMEYVPGDDLLSLVERKPLAIPRTLDLALQIASGLEAAHASGVVHRDLKPGNVRITPDGRVKILDFGLARVRATAASVSTAGAESVQTSEGRIMGTAQYMSPEQARGQPADARSDLFSFGVLLYQTITGHLPFSGANRMEALYSVVNEEPPPLAHYAHGVPDELQRIVGKLLAKQPEDRYQSAHEVLTDLGRLQATVAPAAGARRVAAVPVRRAVAVAAVTVVAIAMVAIAWWVAQTRLAAGGRNVAVLAFQNQSGDSTLDYVGKGLADDVLGDLVQHSDLNVISSAAIAGVKTTGRPLKAVARELGVVNVLAGSLRPSEEGPRLNVELVHAATGRVEWSAGYDYSIRQAFRIKRDILEQVTSRLGARLDLGSSGQRSRYPTRSLTAYDFYLHGVRAIEDPDDALAPDRAADLFGQALVLDPEFALAWAGRSRALTRMYARDKRPETLRSAEQAADRALELAPGLLEARIARAQIYRTTGRPVAAITELGQVLKAKPNWDEAHVHLAATYRDAGRLAEAERSYRRAVELRPDYWRNWNGLGALLVKRGDYAGARRAFQQIVRLVPDKNRGYEQLAVVSMFEGNYEQAVAEYRRLPTPVNDATLASNIASAYFYTGRLDEACEYYALAVRLEPNSPMYRRNLGDLYARQGREQEARTAYREALRLTEEMLRVNPASSDLRMQHILFLAKAGMCEKAGGALAGFPAALVDGASEYAYSAAMVHSLCGRRSEALAGLRRAIALGISPDRIRGDVEFLPLGRDSGFIRLVGGARAGGATGTASGATVAGSAPPR